MTKSGFKKGDRVRELLDGSEGKVEAIAHVPEHFGQPDQWHIVIVRDDGMPVTIDARSVEKI
jgi:hypothetical protein